MAVAVRLRLICLLLPAMLCPPMSECVFGVVLHGPALWEMGIQADVSFDFPIEHSGIPTYLSSLFKDSRFPTGVVSRGQIRA